VDLGRLVGDCGQTVGRGRIVPESRAKLSGGPDQIDPVATALGDLFEKPTPAKSSEKPRRILKDPLPKETPPDLRKPELRRRVGSPRGVSPSVGILDDPHEDPGNGLIVIGNLPGRGRRFGCHRPVLESRPTYNSSLAPSWVVGGQASSYERELKDLLQGQPDAIRRFGRSLPPADRSVIERVAQEPFLVVRAAGSFGFDLVALRREFAFPLEVKSSRSDSILFSAASGRASDQLRAHRASVGRVGLVVLYAYRRIGLRSGDPWRLFGATDTPNSGSIRYLYRRLPPVETTREGHGVLRWEHGMPLVRFLDIVHFLTERPEVPAP